MNGSWADAQQQLVTQTIQHEVEDSCLAHKVIPEYTLVTSARAVSAETFDYATDRVDDVTQLALEERQEPFSLTRQQAEDDLPLVAVRGLLKGGPVHRLTVLNGDEALVLSVGAGPIDRAGAVAPVAEFLRVEQTQGEELRPWRLCSVLLALSGQRPAHSSSISRSVETAWLRCSRSKARTARCRRPPNGRGSGIPRPASYEATGRETIDPVLVTRNDLKDPPAWARHTRDSSRFHGGFRRSTTAVRERGGTESMALFSWRLAFRPQWSQC
jgi:hypothetical protein